MLSTTKTSTDKSVQGELVHTESKDTSIIIKKLMHATVVPHENFQTKNEKFGMKVEQKDLKETEKQERSQTKNENFEMKVEQKDLKETSKQETLQTKNEKFGMKVEQKDLKKTGKQETPQIKNDKSEMKIEQKDLKETGKQETPQIKNEKSEMKIEQKDLKETGKQETFQLLNEQSKVSKPEQQQMKSKTSELKNIELRVEKLKMEDKESKCSVNVNQTDIPKCKMIPIADKFDVSKPSNVAVPRKCPPLSTPLLSERPLVLTTHLVPSLPINLFEVLVEAIEVATEKPVVLLHEPRSDRPVAKEVADIAILPASTEWKDGVLLPVSFCFEHHLNKNNSSCVYADIVVAADRALHVQDITDLRGHRCSLPDRKRNIGAAALLFNYLYMKGESPAFFGNTLDADSQVATLQMVAGKQAEVGVLESPVIKCHKNTLPGINSLHILTSLGPLPPYRVMVKGTLSDVLKRKITTYLLNINQDREWLDRFAPFGVTGFTKNFEKFYKLDGAKSVATSVPYY
ncbi:uncharacterized protein LOC122528846 isoform X1 [Frieseomelitta varia]|uniref:uncharacterized protein LOC122528846 isoform X1 n=1 Tax=Frieseomelitta varia TaxID=561572 RepID=UPI001CB6A6C5|nr:uncharacterized protein LOC122528846 isoform X1 [Frieseomelitta varia]